MPSMRSRWSPTGQRPALAAIRMADEPVPVIGWAANVSPMPAVGTAPLEPKSEGGLRTRSFAHGRSRAPRLNGCPDFCTGWLPNDTRHRPGGLSSRLSGFYRRACSGTMDQFTPSDLAGFPKAAARLGSDGACDATILRLRISYGAPCRPTQDRGSLQALVTRADLRPQNSTAPAYRWCYLTRSLLGQSACGLSG